MEIIERKNGDKYRESITINGLKINSPVFARKTDCRQWLAEQKTNRARVQLHGNAKKLYEKISLVDYATQWLVSKKSQGIARSSYANYERYIRAHIKPFFQSADIKAIQRNQVEKFQSNLKEHHNAKGVNIIVTVLKSIFREAIKDGYILKSPCEFVKSLSKENVDEVFWTLAEIDQFLKANFQHELYNVFLVAINTGMRKGELAGLCWDRVNFTESTISVTRTRDGYEHKNKTKTLSSKRVLPMNELVKATLLNLFEQNNGQDFVFLKADKTPFDPHHLYREFKAAQLKAGLNRTIRFHDLRHTFASQYIMNGGNIYDLQKFMGHANSNQTARYAHHSMEYLHQAMSKFSLGESKPSEIKPEQLDKPQTSNIVLMRDKISSEVTQISPTEQKVSVVEC